MSDAKIIAVPTNDIYYQKHSDISDLDDHMLTEIVHFFETYKLLEKKKVKVAGVRGHEAAIECIKKAFAMYDKKEH